MAIVVTPPPPPSPASPGERAVVGDHHHQVPRKPLARAKSKRKTIMEFIDGWWDLGLLEAQRQNKLARAASSKVPKA
ncbi:uncharacterized protein CTRU02_210140 [Colletotrichum truncatum]|uniref:Uncharacterized protein n=1 Tax=Colletotrichum truncatum TaxID=5467 RepID=A0ACC3YUE2_COLTU|nr:uncharacterized protein CTRU02_15410 [Colletotrichum truncatum]KAF6781072.1 hypothetical protein CTRU02_15410 [Colletotrichum truncatum]